MNLGLEGKRALVTAASAGLGYATALELAREGARVALCSREPDHAQAAADKIRQETGREVLAFAADVASLESLEALFAQAVPALGGLDALVCNAGGPPPGKFEALGEEQWSRGFQLTLMSVVRSIRLALPHLGEGGRILAFTSSSVRRPLDNLMLSNVYRPAVHGLLKTLSLELAPRGLAVNGLAPGRIETERINELDDAAAKRQGTTREEVRARSLKEIPLARLGRPEEFGRVAAFLCSPAASYVTGQMWLVDGGSVTAL
ncbi:MAG TPA: SDR family oxidoreductase [Deinococcales bacterium]|nr:SDR family oxidoreductase [Deinococcales bacterium]